MGGGSFAAIFLQANATEQTFNSTFAPFSKLAAHRNVCGQAGSIPVPRWIDYCNTFLTDPNIATNVIDPSRLFTSDVLLNRTAELIDVALEFEAFSAAFDFSMYSTQS